MRRRMLTRLVCALLLSLALCASTAEAQTGNIATVAGTGTGGFAGENGPATLAELAGPVSVSPMPDGSFLIAEQAGRISRVSPQGILTLFAGGPSQGFGGDGGPATAAQFNTPSDATVMPDGSVLIADTQNHRIRRVATDGTIETVAGTGTPAYGGDNGPADAAQLNFPFDVEATPDGGYLIADVDNHRIRRVAPGGTITTVAGNGSPAFGGDNGAATTASINKPSGVVLMADGGFLIADAANDRVRRVDPGGTITTVAGTGVGGLSGDGGPATDAQINGPVHLAVTPDGGHLIGEDDNDRVRRVSPDGTINTVAGSTSGFSGDGGPATSAQLDRPFGVAVIGGGDILIADSINQRVRFVDAASPPADLAGITPAGPANQNSPVVNGTAAAGTTVRVFADPACSGPSVGGGLATVFANPGLPVTVADDTTTTFYATATDLAGNPSACSITSVTYVEDSATPDTIIDSSPAVTRVPAAPTFAFHSTETGGTFFCKIDDQPSAPCTGPGATHTPLFPLEGGAHTFEVRAADAAGNVDATPATAGFVIDELEPPVQGRRVNAIPKRGTVLVRLPTRGAGQARAAGARFVPLESVGRQLPVGSTLDTRKGTVLLSSARNARGARQDGDFSRGLFNVAQGRKNPLTTLSMTGGGLSSCSKLPKGGARKVTAAARKRRSLFSNVRGRFRTRGRNSTATVRGTSWLTKDTCAGTLTRVSSGSVRVRDLGRRRTRVLRAGQSYMARSPVRKKRR